MDISAKNPDLLIKVLCLKLRWVRIHFRMLRLMPGSGSRVINRRSRWWLYLCRERSADCVWSVYSPQGGKQYTLRVSAPTCRSFRIQFQSIIVWTKKEFCIGLYWLLELRHALNCSLLSFYDVSGNTLRKPVYVIFSFPSSPTWALWQFHSKTKQKKSGVCRELGVNRTLLVTGWILFHLHMIWSIRVCASGLFLLFFVCASSCKTSWVVLVSIPEACSCFFNMLAVPRHAV